jgi:hypothetical protein
VRVLAHLPLPSDLPEHLVLKFVHYFGKRLAGRLPGLRSWSAAPLKHRPARLFLHNAQQHADVSKRNRGVSKLRFLVQHVPCNGCQRLLGSVASNS